MCAIFIYCLFLAVLPKQGIGGDSMNIMLFRYIHNYFWLVLIKGEV